MSCLKAVVVSDLSIHFILFYFKVCVRLVTNESRLIGLHARLPHR